MRDWDPVFLGIGTIIINEHINPLTEKERRKIKNRPIGFVHHRPKRKKRATGRKKRG